MMHKALTKSKDINIKQRHSKASKSFTKVVDSVSSAVLGKFRQPKLRQLSLTGLSQQSKELLGFSVLGFSWLRRLCPLIHSVSEAHSEHIRIGGLLFIIGCLGPLVSESHAKDIWISGLSLWRFIGCCHPVDYRRVESSDTLCSGSPFRAHQDRRAFFLEIHRMLPFPPSAPLPVPTSACHSWVSQKPPPSTMQRKPQSTKCTLVAFLQ